MVSLLPYLKDERICDGVIFAAPDVCRSCERKKVFPCLWRKMDNGANECRYGECFFRRLKTGRCYVGLNKVPENYGPDFVMKVSAFDTAINDLRKSFDILQQNSNEYDENLMNLQKIVEPLARKIEISKINGSIVDVDEKDVAKIIADVGNLRRITTQSNEIINDPDIGRLKLAEEVLRLLCQSHEVSVEWNNKPIVLTLDQLKELSRKRTDQERDESWINVQVAQRGVGDLAVLADKYLKGVNAFNEWVHDVGHYMIRIDKVMPKYSQNQMMVDDVRSLDALITELVLLKIELMDHLGLKSERKLRTRRISLPYYEPYKVFHRHRYCYYGERISWGKEKSEFWRRAKMVRGIDYMAMNLYSNAIKYLRDYPGEKNVETVFDQQPNGVEIRVSSFGPYVRPDELSRLGGEDEFRATSARTYRGMGRGLRRVRRVCKEAGYKVWFSSDAAQSAYPGFAKFTAHIFIPEDSFID